MRDAARRQRHILRSFASAGVTRRVTLGVLKLCAAASRAASLLRTAALFEGPNRPVCHWSVVLKYPANVRCGAGVIIGPRSTLGAAGGIVLGDNVRISEAVLIETAGLDFTDLPPFPHVARPIRIADNVWIGARAIVLAGVTIGRDAVIGAGAIVSRDVPPRGVVVARPPVTRDRAGGRTLAAIGQARAR